LSVLIFFGGAVALFILTVDYETAFTPYVASGNATAFESSLYDEIVSLPAALVVLVGWHAVCLPLALLWYCLYTARVKEYEPEPLPACVPSIEPQRGVIFQNARTEEAVCALPGITGCVVELIRQGNGQWIIAFVTVDPTKTDCYGQNDVESKEAGWLSSLSLSGGSLPACAIPNHFVWVDSLPSLGRDRTSLKKLGNDFCRELPSRYERHHNADKLHLLLESCAERWPNKLAIKGGNGREEVSFSELDQQVRRLHKVLMQTGVEPGDSVATFVEKKDWRCVCTQLAISKCGACFVCFDPMSAPVKQMLHIIKDSSAGTALLTPTPPHCSALLTPNPAAVCLLIDRGADVAWLDVDIPIVDVEAITGSKPTSPKPRPGPGRELPADASYLTYTSGSTGLPKGVLSVHHSCCNYIQSMAAYMQLDNRFDICSVASSQAWDTSIHETYTALASGCGAMMLNHDEVSHNGGGGTLALLPVRIW